MDMLQHGEKLIELVEGMARMAGGSFENCTRLVAAAMECKWIRILMK
jgi:hypothetical protein